jgi:hypothetical protein
MEKLKANASHPTFKKLERIIGLLEHCQINLEWVDGKLKIRDGELAVSFDVVDVDDNAALTELPPLFAYKLTRHKKANPHCRCRHCDPFFGQDG